MSMVRKRIEQLEAAAAPRGGPLTGLAENLAWNRLGREGPRPRFVPPHLTHDERDRLRARLDNARARMGLPDPQPDDAENVADAP